ncbi:MAG: biotin/lipoyl-containing protein [Bacteroidales bacterium]|jgi:biotin carboxyl carrier protein|nr:biotin/lipoyl-containing protein [Bacteroidales bacterium]
MKNYKFIINGNQYEVEIQSLESDHARIEVNGTTYSVDILREKRQVKTPVIVRSPVKEPPKRIEKKEGGPRTAVRTPLPGIILNIYVKAGDTVTKNQKLFSLEAMKMENEIKAEQDGTIVAVKAEIGQSVLQEEVIMEMD